MRMDCDATSNVAVGSGAPQAKIKRAAPPSPHTTVSTFDLIYYHHLIGTRVKLHSLKAKPELNGQRGEVRGSLVRALRSEMDDGRGPARLKPKTEERI